MVEGKLRIGAVSLVLLILSIFTWAGAHAQRVEIWYVFANTRTTPAVIAVAPLTFERPGWSRLSSALESEELAWEVACDRDREEAYYSPDIALGNVRCARSRDRNTPAPRPSRPDPEAITAAPPPPTEPPDYTCKDNGFVGTWSSTESPDTQLWLVGRGRIEGDYRSGRRIEGEYKDCILSGEWIEPDGTRGSLELILAEDGQSFSGVRRERGGRDERLWRGRKLSSNVTRNQ